MRGRAGGPVVIYTCHGFHFYGGQAPLPHAVFRGAERVAAPWTDYLVTVTDQTTMANSNRILNEQRKGITGLATLVPGNFMATPDHMLEAAKSRTSENWTFSKRKLSAVAADL